MRSSFPPRRRLLPEPEHQLRRAEGSGSETRRADWEAGFFQGTFTYL